MPNAFIFKKKVLATGEVSPAWLRYELPKLGIAGSNPALRTFSLLILHELLTRLLTIEVVEHDMVKYGSFLLTIAVKLLTYMAYPSTARHYVIVDKFY